MKATGIVRRIDDLGRVVIPKEIRRYARLREGDPLEIYTNRDGEIILKKYSPIKTLDNLAQDYAESLFSALGLIILITDCDNVVAVSGASKKDFLNKEIGQTTDSIIDRKKAIIINNPDVIVTDQTLIAIAAIAPIVVEGNGIGTVVICSKNPETQMDEMEIRLAETAAAFLASQMKG
jgi:AbrB family transcriptional regulator (stage V sporulation protein T)